uniref:PAZ domain-containing protein n=1 Tax=Caenorhabditis japonica TaxID=281687 RepID=A0A8R1IQR7_CAEJA
MKVTRNYGKNKSLGNEGAIVNIRGVGLPAAECKIVVNNEQTTVEKYFKDRYNIVLEYPKLFTIEARGKFGNLEYIPVELLNVCNFQIVTTEQMSKKEQESLIALSAAKPHLRRATTDAVAKEVGLLSSSINEFLKVADQSETVKGVVLPKPTVLFGQGRKVDWGALARTGNKKPDTDFMAVGQFFQPAQCLNWEVVFNEGGELEGAISQLVSAMTLSGIKVQPPRVTFIRNEDLKVCCMNHKIGYGPEGSKTDPGVSGAAASNVLAAL